MRLWKYVGLNSGGDSHGQTGVGSSIALCLWELDMAGFGLPVMGLHTTSFLCFEARHTWFDLCARPVLGPQMPFFLILALNMCFNWKYVELNSWCEGYWGYTTCSPERCGATHSTAFWKLNMADDCCQSWGYTGCFLLLWG
mmetsp:Transcript_30113/g.78133  ORF Transcript_30113/g.78133 Transcript_30113/m.78133 type:complete len:141 (+) Transcript_30113:631-1053(+)